MWKLFKAWFKNKNHVRTDKQKIGALAEKLAEDFLIQKGFKIIARNFYCKLGEIDRIAWHDETLVFIEIRTRSSSTHGDAASSIDFHKRKKIIRAALFFLKKNTHFANCTVRFDVVVSNGNNPKRSIQWIAAAFQLPEQQTC